MVWLLSSITVVASGCDPGADCTIYIQPAELSMTKNKVPFSAEEIEWIRNVVETTGCQYGFESQPDEYSLVHLEFPRQDINLFALRLFVDPKENRMVVDIFEFPSVEQSWLSLTMFTKIAEQLRSRFVSDQIIVELNPTFDLYKWPGLVNLGRGDILRSGFTGQSISKKQLLRQYQWPDFIQESSGNLIRMQRPYDPTEYAGPKMSRCTFFYMIYNRAVEIRDNCVVGVNPISDEQWEMIFRFFRNN